MSSARETRAGGARGRVPGLQLAASLFFGLAGGVAGTIVGAAIGSVLEGRVGEGAVIFGVPEGEQFVPRLFAEFDMPIKAVSVSRPTLDDVFMSYTGTTIRDAEEDPGRNRNRVMMQMMHGGRR